MSNAVSGSRTTASQTSLPGVTDCDDQSRQPGGLCQLTASAQRRFVVRDRYDQFVQIVDIPFANLKPTDAAREYEKRGIVVYERAA